MTFCLRSPSICHSDSDLSEGSRKYSPSSETSLETQRACGKAETRYFPHVHTHPVAYASKILCVTSFIKPSHRTRRLFIWTNMAFHSFFFICVIAEGSSCSHLHVPCFCLLFCVFLPPASLRRLLRDVLRSLRL